VLNRTGPNTIANEYASVGTNRGMFEADRTQERRVNYTPTLIHRAAATYIYQENRNEEIKRLHAALTNKVNPLSSGEIHFMEMCYGIVRK
jgi:hypothetical protein